MLDNILIGPITLFNSMKDAKDQCNDILSQGYLPIYCLTRGKLVEDIRASLIPEQQKLLKGVILSYTFTKLYEA